MLHALVSCHQRSRAYNRQSSTQQILVESLACFAHALEPIPPCTEPSWPRQKSRAVASLPLSDPRESFANRGRGYRQLRRSLAHDTQIKHDFPFRLARRPSLALLAGKHTHVRAARTDIAHTHALRPSSCPAFSCPLAPCPLPSAPCPLPPALRYVRSSVPHNMATAVSDLCVRVRAHFAAFALSSLSDCAGHGRRHKHADCVSILCGGAAEDRSARGCKWSPQRDGRCSSGGNR